MAKPKKETDGSAGSPVDPIPARIKLTAPHGFVDEAGVTRFWQQDQVVFEPADVARLIERGAAYVIAE